ncbi:MAG TPA: DSD1 family PLP-dependent enzyme [Afifellaceae bacterium]|nr:DSD1 family PLP-dependent enzyme [Afifellaceae bacterium]
MVANPPAEAGMSLSEIDTPALVIDLDAFERNLEQMAGFGQRLGVRLRPHAKTHKSPVIARRQIALGAVGICCQKVSEAEIMVAGGVDDVLVSNQVIGAPKLRRLAALACQARIAVCVDHEAGVAALGEAAEMFGAEIDVLVEIDVGAGRCGVAPGLEALDLARRVADHPQLQFAGLQAYHGAAQHIRDPDQRRTAIKKATAHTRETVDLVSGAGLACRTIGGAGTGTFYLEGASGLYNELQVGSYVFLDADYARNRGGEGAASFEHALFVLATVMSRPAPARAVVDAGLKTFSVDSGLPSTHGQPGAKYVGASDEHGVLDLSGGGNPALGEKVLLVPGHCDPSVNLHDWYVGVRGMKDGAGGHVECVWPVAARGALF